MAGLLGYGGFGGMSGQPPAGLLGKYFDPTQMRNMQLKRGLMGAGIGLLQGGKGSFGEVLGNGLAGGLQQAQQAGDDYFNNSFKYAQIAQQQKELDEKEKQRAAVMSWVGTLSPEDQKLAESFPEQYAQQYLQSKFATTAPKAPSMETLYDEKTGQPYKAQWDTTKNEWVRVGGNKADEAGIEITNPDGTVTRIGGSGTKTTEADRRANLLAQQVVAQEPQLMQMFDSLATAQNTIGSGTGIAGRGLMTAEGQQADDALKNVAANWLYLTSGATAPDSEVKRQFDMIKPTALDQPATIAAKKARLQSMIDTMKQRAGIQTQPQAMPVPDPIKRPPVTINGYTIEEVP